MIISSYFFKIPYRVLWHIARHRNKLIDCAVYCAEPLDYAILEPVIKYLNKPCEYVAKNSKTKHYLRQKGIQPKRMPVFPKIVIMARHSMWKFPVRDILKFGFRHGPYHFKTFTAKQQYLVFTRFFLTSVYEVEEAKSAGITNVQAIGYPKLDVAFNGSWTNSDDSKDSALDKFRRLKGIDNKKPVLLFSSTYERSGMSAVHLWAHRLHELTSDYWILVTLHPWVSRDIYEQVERTSSVQLITIDEHIPAMLASDLTISDTSSIIGEFIALDKRIITFRRGEARRKPGNMDSILDETGYRVDSFNELKELLPKYLTGDDPFLHNRRKLKDLMFCNLGKAGEKAAEIIKSYF